MIFEKNIRGISHEGIPRGDVSVGSLPEGNPTERFNKGSILVAKEKIQNFFVLQFSVVETIANFPTKRQCYCQDANIKTSE